ncbi:hypothetical protein MMMB2_1797 [Mycobacterium marinum MB2]|nr:hypothetical protein MMMB2_1797 [Mycobacterium marinum MB2]
MRLRSAGGRSATQSPTCRSIHFCVLEPGEAGCAGTVAVTAVAALVGGAIVDSCPA